jgi:hypothetical protein
MLGLTMRLHGSENVQAAYFARPAAVSILAGFRLAGCCRRRQSTRASMFQAEVAELADAHGSGPCIRKDVGVRVPSSAPNLKLLTERSA